MRGDHLLFYSHEPAYKMTHDCWLDNRTRCLLRCLPAGLILLYRTITSQREKTITHLHKLNVAHRSQTINAIFEPLD